ncbi:MAG: hypothetical protein LBK60_09890 [Verrucomicrobiales bacterium]|jgi:hypothetical protein|nr:hypothetical protein [Verrucomicrobiales bacterium]
MDKKFLKCRVREAAYINKKIETALKNLDKIPSYTGKARFMDIIIDAHNHSHALAENLKMDMDLES